MNTRKKFDDFQKITWTLIIPLLVILSNLAFPVENDIKGRIREILLNVSLSYIAAYIFYVFQVVLPNKKNRREAKECLYADLNKQMDDIRLALFIFDNLVIVQKKNQYIYTRKRQLYYTENGTNIKKITISSSLKELEQRIRKNDLIIRNHELFGFLEPWIRRVYSDIKIEDLFDLFAQIEGIEDIMLRLEETCVDKIRKNVELLQNEVSNGENKSYEVCNDTSIIKRYDEQCKNIKMEDNELLFSVAVLN